MMAGDVVADRYELEQLVGSGGMSSVFRAHDRVLERTVALKVLHERLTSNQDVVERFTPRGQARRRALAHNIVAVIDRGESDGSPFIVFEYVAGENLKQVIVRDGPLPVDRALELAIEVSRGLAFAHENGLRPPRRQAAERPPERQGRGEGDRLRHRAPDRGAAQARPRPAPCSGPATTSRPSRRRAGTSTRAPTSTRSASCSTSSSPARCRSPATTSSPIAMQHINTAPPPVSLKRPEVPAGASRRRSSRALAKDPAERFATMAAFERELEACLAEIREGGDDRAATGILPVIKPRRSRRRRPGSAAADRRRIARGASSSSSPPSRSGPRSSGDGDAARRHGNGRQPAGPLSVSGDQVVRPLRERPVESHGRGPERDRRERRTPTGQTETLQQRARQLKPGVGIVLDAGSSIAARTLTVTSDDARLPGRDPQAATAAAAGFTDDSTTRTGGTTHDLRPQRQEGPLLPDLDHEPRRPLVGPDQRGQGDPVVDVDDDEGFNGRMRRSLVAGTLAALALAAAAPAAGPTLSFSTFAVTGLPLGQVAVDRQRLPLPDRELGRDRRSRRHGCGHASVRDLPGDARRRGGPMRRARDRVLARRDLLPPSRQPDLPDRPQRLLDGVDRAAPRLRALRRRRSRSTPAASSATRSSPRPEGRPRTAARYTRCAGTAASRTSAATRARAAPTRSRSPRPASARPPAGS